MGDEDGCCLIDARPYVLPVADRVLLTRHSYLFCHGLYAFYLVDDIYDLRRTAPYHYVYAILFDMMYNFTLRQSGITTASKSHLHLSPYSYLGSESTLPQCLHAPCSSYGESDSMSLIAYEGLSSSSVGNGTMGSHLDVTLAEEVRVSLSLVKG